MKWGGFKIKIFRNKKSFLIILITFLIGIYLASFFPSVKPVDSRNTSYQIEHHSPPSVIIEPGSSVEVSSYIVFHDDDTPKNYYAKNGSTGAIDYSGTNASQIIQNVMDALTSGRTWREKVVLKGSFEINTTIIVPSHTEIVIYGMLRLADAAVQHILTLDHVEDVKIVGGKLDGNKESFGEAALYTHVRPISTNSSSRIIIEYIEIVDSVEDGIYGLYLNDSIINRCNITNSFEAGLAILGGSRNIITHCHFENNSDPAVATDGLRIVGQVTAIAENNLIFSNSFKNNIDYDLELAQYTQDNYVLFNTFLSTTNTGFINEDGSNIIKNNPEYVTENSGTTTVANNGWFAHELATTPTAVTLTPMNATYDGVAVVSSWVDINSTHVQVGLYWANSTAITDQLMVSWYAEG